MLLLAACSGPPAPAGAPPIGGDRPVQVRTPPGLGAPAPLLLMLHGYGGTGDREDGYSGFGDAATAAGMIFALPEGTQDDQRWTYWNASDACCGKADPKADDSAYLSGVIGEIAARYPVDPKRVYVFGFSNGGFMAHRLACEHAGLIAGIGSAAGAGVPGCAASGPVTVLQIHGDADATILYNGGTFDAEYPGAVQTVKDWAARNGCGGTPVTGRPRDLAISVDAENLGSARLDGAESTTAAYPGCPPGGAVELWTIAGGDHAPGLSATYAAQVVEFLLAHPKP